MKLSDIKKIAHSILENQNVENSFIEYKKSINFKDKILKTACAFANNYMNNEINFLFIGVEEVDNKENGEKAIPKRPISGIKESMIEGIENDLKSLLSNITPKINYHIIQDKIDNKYYLVVAIEQGSNGPYQTNEKAEKDKEIKLKILEKIEDKFSLDIEVDAGISILKGDKMDLTIQKLTELGINKIIPISVKRCVVKLDKKKDRWDTISKEALKQCQGVVPTVIDEIKKINKLNFKDYDLILVPYENEKEIFIKEILRDLKIKPSKILYIIGAEGGFEKEEIDYLKENGAKIISLGKRILRAETAAIVTGGVIINEFL